MEHRKYSAIPMLNEQGQYVGTLTEGDLLWNIKNKYNLDLREAEKIPITNIDRRRDYIPISVRADMEDLVRVAINQNFVPVLDDEDKFIGIVTRKDIMKFFYNYFNKLCKTNNIDKHEAMNLEEVFETIR